MSTLCISALPPGDAARRSRLVRLARALAEQDGPVRVLLYGDGVFNLVKGGEAAAELTQAPVELYAVADDVAARGLGDRVIPEARLIDYGRAVELVMEAARTVTGV